MSDRRILLFVFAIAVLIVFGLMSLVIPAASETPVPPTVPPPDVEATVRARLTALARDASLYLTATEIVGRAIGEVFTATALQQATLADAAARLSETARLASTATALVALTGTAVADAASTALAAPPLTGTAVALLAEETATALSDAAGRAATATYDADRLATRTAEAATAGALTATVDSLATRLADAEGRQTATAEARFRLLSEREAALRGADLLQAENAGRLAQLAVLPYSGPVEAFAISPGGQRVAGASGNTVVLWSLPSGQEMALLDHTRQVTALAFSPDGGWLATATSAGEIYLWDAHDGVARFTLRGHSAEVYHLAFGPGPDGAATESELLLASASADGVFIWQVQTGTALAHLATGWAWSVRFSPGGRHVITAGEGGVRVWGVPLHPTSTPSPSPSPTPLAGS